MVPSIRNFPLRFLDSIIAANVMDAKGSETGLMRHKSINSTLVTGEDDLGAIEMLQFSCHITSEERLVMKLEDISARFRNASAADGRQISPFRSRFQAIEDHIWRERSI
jgi:hypothetical protein